MKHSWVGLDGAGLSTALHKANKLNSPVVQKHPYEDKVKSITKVDNVTLTLEAVYKGEYNTDTFIPYLKVVSLEVAPKIHRSNLFGSIPAETEKKYYSSEDGVFVTLANGVYFLPRGVDDFTDGLIEKAGTQLEQSHDLVPWDEWTLLSNAASPNILPELLDSGFGVKVLEFYVHPFNKLTRKNYIDYHGYIMNVGRYSVVLDVQDLDTLPAVNALLAQVYLLGDMRDNHLYEDLASLGVNIFFD